jgi:DNA-binding XRE family transcriptional regulator
MVFFRHDMALTQVEAAKFFGCSGPTIAHIETGRFKLGQRRRERMEQGRAAFASGGLEAVLALPPMAPKPVGGYRTPVPPEDRDNMVLWRCNLALTQAQAARQLGLSIHTIRAIEHGRLRITERVAAFMLRDEKEGRRQG